MTRFSVLSPLQSHRLNYLPTLPLALNELIKMQAVHQEISISKNIDPKIKDLFPNTRDQNIVTFEAGKEQLSSRLKVGIVFSGGQAPGGHNVIAGVLDALHQLHSESTLIGFLDGPSGIIENKNIPLNQESVAHYRNQGGFDLIGSGRIKIETAAQFQAAENTIRELNLDGLIVIGGDDSNTNAAHLAEYFRQKKLSTRVVGVPKTIDGDLKNEFIQISFGFDTACKVYSEIIGNLAKDALSAKKYYFFVKLMGRSASHITLECALRNQVNLALIGEEILSKKQSLNDIIHQIADMICARANIGKNYGVILIPEGIIEFIDDFNQMIQELNSLLHRMSQPLEWAEQMESLLSLEAFKCFNVLPEEIKKQLLLDRDPHGNVQVSKIETERLLMDLVEKELQRRKLFNQYTGQFSAQPMFCGYEGRSALPSNFDCQYCYALGHVATLLIHLGLTGYMSSLYYLDKPVEKWEPRGIPLTTMLCMENRKGKEIPVLQKNLVNLEGPVFKTFEEKRSHWLLEDDYLSPGPIQFEGPSALTEIPVMTLLLESE